VGRNVSRSTAGNGVVGAASVGISVEVGCDVRNEERKSDERQREQETHL
jgi:hypothetical protein